jgi:hypothetical protein
VIVSGGTYRERIISTDYVEDLGGSGMRASVLLAGAGVNFVTAVEEAQSSYLSGMCDRLGIRVENAGRDRSVEFAYRAPFVEPILFGGSARLDRSIHLEGDSGLVYGLVESGERDTQVDALVYDPQSTTDVIQRGVLPWRRPKRLCICANSIEVLALGHHKQIEAASVAIAERLEADVVIAKAGARGCLVTEREEKRQTWIGAYPTAMVLKLGSGDVFSAAFAHLWCAGASAIDAARYASAVTAWWCQGSGSRLSEDVLAGATPSLDITELANHGNQPTIYLAGPFFTTEQRWLVDQCKQFLEHAGALVFSPVHEIGLGGPEVAQADLAGLSACDAVFAILDGWDPGTIFETGWATARGIPVVAAGGLGDPVGATMLIGTGAEQYSDFATGMYRAIWRGLGT